MQVSCLATALRTQRWRKRPACAWANSSSLSSVVKPLSQTVGGVDLRLVLGESASSFSLATRRPLGSGSRGDRRCSSSVSCRRTSRAAVPGCVPSPPRCRRHPGLGHAGHRPLAHLGAAGRGRCVARAGPVAGAIPFGQTAPAMCRSVIDPRRPVVVIYSCGGAQLEVLLAYLVRRSSDRHAGRCCVHLVGPRQ